MFDGGGEAAVRAPMDVVRRHGKALSTSGPSPARTRARTCGNADQAHRAVESRATTGELLPVP
ncbi:hypothetical protein EAO68_12945 [Streptomyces sp. wa22]|nr:hypothetical protein EAO68_12945 [Streptomyces sp. wa22]